MNAVTKEVYFDNASTTRLSKAAIEAGDRINNEFYANPASLHSLGIAAEGKIISAAKKLSGYLGITAGQILFTSGGTESNNLAVFGVCGASRHRHIISTRTEHPSVTEALKRMERNGYEVQWLSVDEGGQIDMDELSAAVRADTMLVSLMHVNNETGVICDISRAAEVVKAKNPDTVFHSDGVQAFGKLKTPLKNIDLYSLNAHKIHGPRGVGALYVRKGVRLTTQIYGGGQQQGLRSGTENTAGVFGFAVAAEDMHRCIDENFERVSRVRDALAEIVHEQDGIYINGAGECSPYILNMSFIGANAETLLHCLEQEGIYVSTGAACGSKHSLNILAHYGLDKSRVESALRFSFSAENTVEEAQRTKQALIKYVRNLRALKRKGR